MAAGQASTRAAACPVAVFTAPRPHAQRDVVEADARGAAGYSGAGDRRARFGRDREGVGVPRFDRGRVVFANERRVCTDGLRKDFGFGPRTTIDQVDHIGRLWSLVDQRSLHELPVQVQRAVTGAGDREVR